MLASLSALVASRCPPNISCSNNVGRSQISDARFSLRVYFQATSNFGAQLVKRAVDSARFNEKFETRTGPPWNIYINLPTYSPLFSGFQLPKCSVWRGPIQQLSKSSTTYFVSLSPWSAMCFTHICINSSKYSSGYGNPSHLTWDVDHRAKLLNWSGQLGSQQFYAFLQLQCPLNDWLSVICVHPEIERTYARTPF